MGLHDWACVHEGGGRWLGSNKLVELKKKRRRRIHFPMQRTRVWSLVRELRSHMPRSNWAHTPQLRPNTAKQTKSKAKKEQVEWWTPHLTMNFLGLIPKGTIYMMSSLIQGGGNTVVPQKSLVFSWHSLIKLLFTWEYPSCWLMSGMTLTNNMSVVSKGLGLEGKHSSLTPWH